MKPIVAIVGRANVGKSALFNRLIGKRVAIVEDLPGTTRDRVFADTSLRGYEVTLIDTGGLEPASETPMTQKINYQVEAAISEADVIIFLTDIKDGPIATDFEIADKLRTCNRPVVLAANKADNSRLADQTGEFYQIGLDTPVAISALHGRGINNLVDAVVPHLPSYTPEIATEAEPKLAIVGRPNVGKSMLLNALVGEERAIVDYIPGTTRDTVDTLFTYNEQELLLIDTAGIRRRGRSGVGVDYYSIMRSLRAISRCDIALLVVDAAEFITSQDAHIAGYVKQACKGIMLIINKWDLISDTSQEEYTSYVRERFPFLDYAPVLYVSAQNGYNIEKVIPRVLTIWHERQKQLPNSVIDKLIKQAVMNQAPPRKGFKRLEIIRAYQNGVNPPSFLFLVNDPTLLHFSYERYLENKLRQTFGFSGTSLRFAFKKAPKRKAEKIARKRQ
jgi:GTP-binding protein